ncbi:hypothetical protein ACFFLM_16540 [Deinococcus oregonensis]|uniref:Uncharacterized protein n=1 Tax=Deinococcus oregonensis TaxID=1805970 RepID=A0ABV6B1E2_9DEIO
MTDFPTGEGETGGVQQVFLLEDNAGGGLILSADSMQRLPQWPEGVSELLGSVSAVLHALPALQAAGPGNAELGSRAEQYLEYVLAEAGRQLECCTGRLEVGSQVVYLGSGGSFVCGPVPWTQPRPLSASRLAPPTAMREGTAAPELTYDDPSEQLLGWERAR